MCRRACARRIHRAPRARCWRRKFWHVSSDAGGTHGATLHSVRHELVCTAEDLREPSPQTPRRRRHRFMNVTHTNVHTSHELDHTVGTLSTIID